MSGYGVDLAALEGLASRLRDGADDLESGASLPPPPEAGEITDVVEGLVAALSVSLAGVVEGIGAIGDSVVSSRDIYGAVEQDSRNQIGHAGPR